MPISQGATHVQGLAECGSTPTEGFPVTIQGCGPGAVPVPVTVAGTTGCVEVEGCPGGAPVEVTGPAGAPVAVTPTAAGPGGEFTDRSGTITAGNTAQVLEAANAARTYLLIQNNGVNDLWFNFLVTAVQSQPSFLLEVGATVEFHDSDRPPTSAISIIGPTTGQAFTAKTR